MNKMFFVVLMIVVLASSGLFAGNRICLDPGHGGTDGGNPGPNGLINEKDVNLNVALAALDTFNFWFGFDVGLTRTSDVTTSITSRVNFANNSFGGFGYDYFVSIHHNSMDPPCTAQGTEMWHCRSDTIYGSGGQHREVDTLLGYKIYLRIVEEWDAVNDPYVARGLRHDCGLMVLKWTRMISCLSEASFLCDPNEEALFADSESGHTEQEARAIHWGFRSYCDNAGIAMISNRYLEGDSGYLEIDYVPLISPIERTWAIAEGHNLYTRDNFYLNGYWYYFNHWAHLASDGTYLGPDHLDNE